MLTDADILARLAAVEDGTVERKSISDNRDWIKAVVAFSNSLDVGQPGVLFVGVKDNGTIQKHQTDFEALQKTVSGELSNIYPRVYPTILVREKDGKKFVVVIVYGSPDRPHFAGKSYFRDGTQTKEASEPQIQEFIDKRSGKVAEILKWKNKEITLYTPNRRQFVQASKMVTDRTTQILHDCNQHWLTVREPDTSPALASISLSHVELAYDHKEGRLVIEVSPDSFQGF